MNGSAALRFLDHAPPDLDEVRLALDRMVKDSHRASQVFDNIRALFGRSDQKHEPIDVNELARDVLNALHGELLNVTTQAALISELPPVMGHRGQLQEVLVNLVRNAVEAALESGCGDDCTNNHTNAVQVQKPQVTLNWVVEDQSIVLMIEDNGLGLMNPSNAFVPFYTTKPSGSGIGLALSRQIVEAHGGSIELSNLNGKRGCQVRVRLPCS